MFTYILNSFESIGKKFSNQSRINKLMVVHCVISGVVLHKMIKEVSRLDKEIEKFDRSY